jgi:uncharacterized membrane protein
MSQDNQPSEENGEAIPRPSADRARVLYRLYCAVEERYDNRGTFLSAILTLIELAIALGLCCMVQYQIYQAGRRASGHELSVAGVALSFVALCIGLVVAMIFFWKVHRDARFGMWLTLNIFSSLAIASGLAAPLAKNEALRQKEVKASREVEQADIASRAAWIERLKSSASHGPPGIVPPMLKVEDHGTTIRVQNIGKEEVRVALGKVSQDSTAPGGWKWCGTSVEDHPGLTGISLGSGKVATYRLYGNCAAHFEEAPIEYRVGGVTGIFSPNQIGWWSDSAFPVAGRRN